METPAPPKPTLRVVVKSLDGNVMRFDVPRGAPIRHLKKQIEEVTSLPLERVRLVFRARVLDDDTLIEKVVSEDDTVFHLIAKTSEEPTTRVTPPQPAPTNPSPPNQPPTGLPPRPHLPPHIHLQAGHTMIPMPPFPFMAMPHGGPIPQMHTNLGAHPSPGMRMTPPGPIPNLLQNLFPGHPLVQQQASANNNPAPAPGHIQNQRMPDAPALSQQDSERSQPDVPLTPSPQTPTSNQGQFNFPAEELGSILNQLQNVMGGLQIPLGENPQQNPTVQVNPFLRMFTGGMTPHTPGSDQQAPPRPSHSLPAQNPPAPGHSNAHPGINPQTSLGANLPAPQAQAPQGPTLVASHQGGNQVSSVSNQGITVHIPTLRGPTQQLLNTQILRENEALIRESGQIDFEIPRRIETNNSATMVGNYLTTVHDHLERFLPTLKKGAKALKSEQRLRAPEDRAKATLLLRNLGKSIRHLQKVFEGCQFLENFELKNSVGQFELKPVADAPVHQAPNAPAPQAVHQPARVPPQVPPQNAPQHAPQRPAANAPEDDVDSEEEQMIERQRQQLHQMTNLLMQGVPANTTLQQMTAAVNSGDEENDVISLVMAQIGIGEVMEVVMQQSVVPFDRNYPKIKRAFQNLLINRQNNDDAVRTDIFKNELVDLSKQLVRYGRDMLYEGFDPKATIDEVCRSYYPKFKAMFLGTNHPEESFGEAFKNLMIDFHGKLAYEVSEGMTDGISSFHHVFKKSVVEHWDRIVGMPLPGLEMMLEERVWKYVFQGYQAHKREADREGASRALLNNLLKERDDREGDDEGGSDDSKPSAKPTLSDSYLKGKSVN